MILWHNPRCSKSRQALQLLRDHGTEPDVRLYLQDPPSLAELQAAHQALGLDAIDMVRKKDAGFAELGLDANSPDEALLAALAKNPKLIERPIAFAKGRAAIGRPPEAVLDLL